MKLSKKQKDEIKDLYSEWEYYDAEAQNCEQQAENLRRKLSKDYNIDVDDPPDWITL